MAEPKRLLGAVRLSRLTDETTSPERQREQITLTAKVRGDELVKIVQDLDVSGAVSVWGRDLEPWLTEPALIGSWDALIVAKLDRLTRSLTDFGKLLEWCKAHDKTVISVAESLDFGSAAGRLFANILIMFAQFERERIGERRAEAAKTLRNQGYWQGEGKPYGYRPVKVGNHYELELDPEQTKEANWMADGILSGKSMNQTARELIKRGVPAPRGGVWTRTTISRILRSPSINGQAVVWESKTQYRVIPGVKRTPVIDDDKWARLLTALDNASVTWSNRFDAAPLLDVAFCHDCSAKLYGSHRISRGRQYDYYRCSQCKARNIPMAELHEAVNEAMIDAYGAYPDVTKKLVRGDDRERALKGISRSIQRLGSDLASEAINEEDYQRQLGTLLAERTRLKSLPPEPDRFEYEWGDKSIADTWLDLDLQGRRQWLREHGWKAYAKRSDEKGMPPIVTIETGDYFIGAYLEAVIAATKAMVT